MMIRAVLIYARRSDGCILMIHKQRPGDIHQGKWNGLGGKCEPSETPRDSAVREFFEESGLKIAAKRFDCLGSLSFPLFKAGQDWLVWIFAVDLDSGELPQASCNEGSLHFIEPDRLLALNLWEGDRNFLPLVLKRQCFVGEYRYVDGQLRDGWLEVMSGETLRN